MKKTTEIKALEDFQENMKPNELWLMSHDILNIDIAIRQQKSWSALLSIIKKVSKSEFGASVGFVKIIMRTYDGYWGFEIKLTIKSRPITVDLTKIKIYE